MAPERQEAKRLRWFLIGAIAVLALVVAVLSIIGFSLRARLATVESERRAEKVAATTAEIATCFATARSRPNLIVILNLISSLADDTIERDIVKTVIDDYRLSAPTLEACQERAIKAGLKPEDFPPVNRGEDGNGR